tara:strand:+ start:184 stop:468 length:285 start_codon:yes stop_codon:yes gene_type:complete
MSKYCQHCGSNQNQLSTTCNNCGKSPFITFDEKDSSELNFGLKAVSFCIPLAGIILYFVHKSNSPRKSKQACHSALYGMLLGFIFQILVTMAGA